MDRTELVERYRRADLDCAKVDYRLRGAKMYERETLAPTRENRRALEAQLSAARAQVAALEAPEPAFALMKAAFRRLSRRRGGAAGEQLFQAGGGHCEADAQTGKPRRRRYPRRRREGGDPWRAAGRTGRAARRRPAARAVREGSRHSGACRRVRRSCRQLPPLRRERRPVFPVAVREGGRGAREAALSALRKARRVESRPLGRRRVCGRRRAQRSVFGGILPGRARSPARRRAGRAALVASNGDGAHPRGGV